MEFHKVAVGVDLWLPKEVFNIARRSDHEGKSSCWKSVLQLQPPSVGGWTVFVGTMDIDGMTTKKCCKQPFEWHLQPNRGCNLCMDEWYDVFWRLGLWCGSTCAAYVTTEPRKRGGKNLWKRGETWRETEMHRENTTSQPERNTLTLSVISIADASDRKCEWASCIQPESEHCPRTAQSSYCTAKCGSWSQDPVLCSGQNPLWICVGFKAFLLSQPNVKVRM